MFSKFFTGKLEVKNKKYKFIKNITKSPEDQVEKSAKNNSDYIRQLRWYWLNLLSNPNMSLKDIFEHSPIIPKYSLKFPVKVSSAEEIMELNRIFGWKYPIDVTLQNILDYPDLLWDWYWLSSSPNITLKFVLDNLDKSWNWYALTENPAISLQNILDTTPGLKWTIKDLPLQSHRFSMEILLKNPDFGWNWFSISIHSGIIMEDVQNYPNLPWNWLALSSNPNLTIKFVLNNLDKPWYWEGICMNPYIPVSDSYMYLKSYFQHTYPQIQIYLSSNKGITIQDVISHPEFPWKWYTLSSNPGITVTDIVNNPDLPWNWDGISQNPNITIRDIIYNIDKDWQIRQLIGNKMYYDPFYTSKLHRTRLAKEIANLTKTEEYIAKIYNPNRMRSFTSIQDLEEMRQTFGWSMEEFSEYIT